MLTCKRKRFACLRACPWSIPKCRGARTLQDRSRPGAQREEMERESFPREQFRRRAFQHGLLIGFLQSADGTEQGPRQDSFFRSGVPLNLVQRWLGHARMETTAIYLQAMGDEEREIAARMWVAG